MKKILAAAIISLTIFIFGCSIQSPEENKPPNKNVEQPEEKNNESESKPSDEVTQPKKPSAENLKSMKIKIYYPDGEGMNLVGVTREIKFSKDADKYAAAVKLLMESPKEKDLTKIFPAHAKLRSVTLDGNTAIVDFSGDITKGFSGGSTGEELLINSVVDTLTEFPEINQVKFLIDGKEVETLAGHMDLSLPLTRNP